MTRWSPWYNQQESASCSRLGRGFHRKSAGNPPKRRAWTPPAPQIEPHHRGATAHTTQNHRGSSSSHRSAPSLRHPKAPSGVRWPSTNHEEAPRSVLTVCDPKATLLPYECGQRQRGVTAHAVRKASEQTSQLMTRAQQEAASPAELRKTQTPSLGCEVTVSIRAVSCILPWTFQQTASCAPLLLTLLREPLSLRAHQEVTTRHSHVST